MNQYCTNCGSKLNKENKYCITCGFPQAKIKKQRSWVWLIIFGICIFLLLLAITSTTENNSSTSLSPYQESNVDSSFELNDENEIEGLMDEFKGQQFELSNTTSAATVNVLCPYAGTEMSFDSDGSGGSGVVIQSEGIVLTNSHVIPQDDETLDINEEGCIVLFPDPETGLPMQAYLADPIVIPGLSDDYDLAILNIYDVYRSKSGISYGTYPNNFPTISDDNCDDESIRLGEKVTVFGYPSVTGGYFLTVTDGVISALNSEGIVISAKIDLGNSGGLAVDDKGCFLGVPTLVNYGDSESYGIIIPASDVVNFIDKLSELYEEES